MARKARNGGKTDKRDRSDRRGAHRAAWDAAAALDALKWAQGGVQVELPGIGARRFVGVEPLPDDGAPRSAGRPPGAQNLVPQAFREYLAAKYGSPVEGLAQFASRPVVSIVAELVEAYQAVSAACGLSGHLWAEDILALTTMVPGLQLQARRYAAPYMHTQAPQPAGQVVAPGRIAVAMFTGGQPKPEEIRAAGATLAGLLGIEENQRVIEGESVELDAGELDGDG